MTRIDFYVAQTHALQARLRLACQLVQKAYQRSLHTYIHTDAAHTSAQIDEMLWTFHDLAFIPHALAPATDAFASILIGHDYEPITDCDLLINLSNTVPAFFPRFTRMAEILDQEDTVLHAGRKRYQFYRDRGYTLNYHQL